MSCGEGGCLRIPSGPGYECDDAITIAQTIVDTGLDVLADFICDDVECILEGRVSHGEPVIERPNVIVSWIVEQTLEFPIAAQGLLAYPKALIRSQVWVRCWPTPAGPVDTKESAAVAWALGKMGETWYRGVHHRMKVEHGGCQRMVYSPLIPLGPLAQDAGWQFDLNVTL